MTEERILDKDFSQNTQDIELKYATEIPFVRRLRFKYDYQDNPMYDYDDLINKSKEYILPEDCRRSVLDYIYSVLECYWETEQDYIKEKIIEFQFCSKHECLTVVVNKNTSEELAKNIFNKLKELNIGQNNEIGGAILDNIIIGYEYIGPGKIVYISVLHEGFVT